MMVQGTQIRRQLLLVLMELLLLLMLLVLLMLLLMLLLVELGRLVEIEIRQATATAGRRDNKMKRLLQHWQFLVDDF